jgi:predicted ester cyclase
MTTSEIMVSELYERVWSEGDYSAVARLIAPHYTIHSDPGDAWEGQSLDLGGYVERARFSRGAFPDLRFEMHDLVAAGDRVAVRWSAAGTQLGPLPGLAASGRRLTFSGQTMYELKSGRIAGHWQVVDRLGFVQQLR